MMDFPILNTPSIMNATTGFCNKIIFTYIQESSQKLMVPYAQKYAKKNIFKPFSNRKMLKSLNSFGLKPHRQWASTQALSKV